MKHEHIEGFMPEENAAYAELICEGFTEAEIAVLEEESDKGRFNLAVMNVYRQLAQATDFFCLHTNPEVVAAALAMLVNEYEELTGGDDDAES